MRTVKQNKEKWKSSREITQVAFSLSISRKGADEVELVILIVAILAFLLELFVWLCCIMAAGALDEETKSYEYDTEKCHRR